MKLIDLLVQELPKRGGWPNDCEKIEMSGMGKLFGSSYEYLFDSEIFPKPLDWKHGVVTREEYQAAIAASKQPAWNGEGLPPVGCECEFKEQNKDEWRKCVIRYVSDYTIVVDTSPDKYESDDEEPCFVNDENILFRPIRTEAERKRDEAIKELENVYRSIPHSDAVAYGLYDAIATGKIPGVKLAD